MMRPRKAFPCFVVGAQVMAAWYKKNISFIHALDFISAEVSYVCANKFCGLMWMMHLRNNVCDDVSMPKCDSCCVLFWLTWHSLLSGQWAIHASSAPEVKASEKSEL